jgi:type II secretory pathway pseudopilin PulG
MSKRRNWPWILFGVGVVIIVIGIAAIVATTGWVQQNLTVQDSTEADAEREFDAVRTRFAGRPPLMELRDGRPVYTGGTPPEAPGSPPSLDRLHVLVWDPTERRLASFALPFWFLRLKSGPIEFSAYASGMDDEGVNLRPEDIEKFGPGIVIDTTSPSGERVLVWTQ